MRDTWTSMPLTLCQPRGMCTWTVFPSSATTEPDSKKRRASHGRTQTTSLPAAHAIACRRMCGKGETLRWQWDRGGCKKPSTSATSGPTASTKRGYCPNVLQLGSRTLNLTPSMVSLVTLNGLYCNLQYEYYQISVC